VRAVRNLIPSSVNVPPHPAGIWRTLRPPTDRQDAGHIHNLNVWPSSRQTEQPIQNSNCARIVEALNSLAQMARAKDPVIRKPPSGELRVPTKR
jgi:hypothetical protein